MRAGDLDILLSCCRYRLQRNELRVRFIGQERKKVEVEEGVKDSMWPRKDLRGGMKSGEIKIV